MWHINVCLCQPSGIFPSSKLQGHLYQSYIYLSCLDSMCNHNLYSLLLSNNCMFINRISQEEFKPLEDTHSTPSSVMPQRMQIKYQEVSWLTWEKNI